MSNEVLHDGNEMRPPRQAKQWREFSQELRKSDEGYAPVQSFREFFEAFLALDT
jgi:hypothetical protein